MRSLPRGFFPRLPGGSVRLGVHPVPRGFVRHFVGCHVFGGLLGVSGGLLQLNSKRCEPLNVPSLPCKYVFFYNGCTQHFSLLKLRRGAAVPARFYNSDSQYVRRRLALFFPRDARQRGRDP